MISVNESTFFTFFSFSFDHRIFVNTLSKIILTLSLTDDFGHAEFACNRKKYKNRL